MNIEPTGPYIYQPYDADDPERGKSGRLFAIDGLPDHMVLDSLTKMEAECILALLMAINNHPDNDFVYFIDQGMDKKLIAEMEDKIEQRQSNHTLVEYPNPFTSAIANLGKQGSQFRVRSEPIRSGKSFLAGRHKGQRR